MYVDGYILFGIYAIACIAAAISVYCIIRLKEIEEWIVEKMRTRGVPGNAWDHYHDKANQKGKVPKSPWNR